MVIKKCELRALLKWRCRRRCFCCCFFSIFRHAVYLERNCRFQSKRATCGTVQTSSRKMEHCRYFCTRIVSQAVWVQFVYCNMFIVDECDELEYFCIVVRKQFAWNLWAKQSFKVRLSCSRNDPLFRFILILHHSFYDWALKWIQFVIIRKKKINFKGGSRRRSRCLGSFDYVNYWIGGLLVLVFWGSSLVCPHAQSTFPSECSTSSTIVCFPSSRFHIVLFGRVNP